MLGFISTSVMAPVFAYENHTVSTATSAAIDLINEAAPQVVANSVTPRLTNGEMSILLSSGTVLATKSGQLHVDINGASLMMTLPSAGIARLEQSTENITFSNGDGSTTSVFADEGNSVTAITTIRDSASPTEFSYVYSGIDEIRVASDGGLSIWQDGQKIGFFMLPWALDANGTEVPTHYELDGLTLTQIVEHDTGNFVYPIVADPSYYLGSNSLYWASMNTSLDPHGVVIQIVPQPNINWGHMARSNGIPPYDQLVPSTYRTNAMHDQLVCHWVSAGYWKVPWNLDSWRPDVGYPATVLALCNP